MRWLPILFIVGFASLAAGCGSSGVEQTSATGSVQAEGTLASVDAASTSGSLVLGPATATVGAASATLVAVPTPPPGLIGSWRLAPSGSRSCTIDLSPPDRLGETAARTRGCADIALSRVALWSGSPDSIVLSGPDRATLALLRQESPGLYQGPLVDGRTITVWR